MLGFFKQIHLWCGDGEGFAHRFVFLKRKPTFSDCQYCALQTVKIKRTDSKRAIQLTFPFHTLDFQNVKSID